MPGRRAGERNVLLDQPALVGAAGALLALAGRLNALEEDLAVESPDADVRKVAQAAYAQALSVATTAYTGLPKIDRWRYERARLLADKKVSAVAGSIPVPWPSLTNTIFPW